MSDARRRAPSQERQVDDEETKTAPVEDPGVAGRGASRRRHGTPETAGGDDLPAGDGPVASDVVGAGAAESDSSDAPEGGDVEEMGRQALVDAAEAAGLPELTPLEVALAERDEYLDAMRRLQADFENFRKRVRRQEEEQSIRSIETLVDRLLPVLDAVELATEHAAESDAVAFGQVAQLLKDALAKEGLERIDGVGVPFEPAIHDAVARVPWGEPGDGDEGSDEDRDIQVVDAILRPGFMLKGKVLRPAMVKVKG